MVEEPPRSEAYYLAHAEEAKQMTAQCRAFAANELSVMPPSKQLAWKETSSGINCANAETANEQIVRSARQQRMIEAARKYH
jgi:hypothetical protein